MAAARADNGADWASADHDRVGDPAARDVVAPFDLELLDPSETARARHAATAGLPAVMVTDGLDGAATKEAVRASFEETRARFVDAVRDRFSGHPIGHREANSSRFRDFRLEFQRENPGYPVGNLLGLTWALGRDDSRLLAPVLETITSAFDGILVVADPPDLPAGELLVLDPDEDPSSTASARFESGRTWKVSQIETVDTVGTAIRGQLEVGYRPVAAYVGGLVRPNVRFDETLTDAYRDWRSQSIRVTARFQTGDVIVRKGEPMTELALLALREIETVGAEPSRVAPSGIVASQPGVAVRQHRPGGMSGIHYLVPALLALVLIALIIVIVLVVRHHRASVTAFKPGGSGLPVGRTEGLAARMARELSGRLIEGGGAGTGPAGGGFSMAELEGRLKRLEPRILERIRSFEERLSRLEDRLSRMEPGKDARLRSRIDDVRDQLNAELSRYQIDLN